MLVTTTIHPILRLQHTSVTAGEAGAWAGLKAGRLKGLGEVPGDDVQEIVQNPLSKFVLFLNLCSPLWRTAAAFVTLLLPDAIIVRLRDEHGTPVVVVGLDGPGRASEVLQAPRRSS